MENRHKKYLIIGLVIAYVIAPDLFAGPIDDIIAILIGAGVLKTQGYSKG